MRRSYFLGAALLLSYAARAQQPIQLPGAPTVPPPAPGAPLPAPRPAALPTAEVVGHPGEVIGQTYSVETLGGIQFSGTLREATPESLTFETRELGLVTIQRVNLRQLTGQTPEQARRGFDYVGNGTRMFLAPTARNLHQGEGSVQVVNIFVLAGSYGITDNISVGAVVPVIPFVGIPFAAVTGKASVPVGQQLRLGAGLLYGFGLGSNTGGAGVAVGLATYGSADANVSLGVGYGFSSDGDIGRTPVGMAGFNVRVSRLFSLVNETYFANLSRDAGVAGLAGVRYAAPRFSGSLGLLYVASSHDGFVYPAYLNVAFRFGKVRLR